MIMNENLQNAENLTESEITTENNKKSLEEEIHTLKVQIGKDKQEIIDTNNKSEEFISLELLYNKILNLFKEEKDSNINNNDIFSIFESEFGRTITPMEYEIIKGWFADKFSYEIIIEALKEATYNNVTNLNYIDKILYEWNRKGLKTREDVIRDKNNYRNSKKKPTEVFDYNWLEDE